MGYYRQCNIRQFNRQRLIFNKYLLKSLSNNLSLQSGKHKHAGLSQLNIATGSEGGTKRQLPPLKF